MILATTLGHSLARGALILDALVAAEALCAVGRTRRIAVAGALALTPVLLAATLWRSSQLLHLRHHALLAVAGLLGALALIGALALLYRARPSLLALCAVMALPFRFSLLSGGTGGVLLALYLVIGAGAVALVLWGEGREEPAVGLVERALAVFIVLYAIGALYTPDVDKAVQETGFFLVPFALLFVLLRRVAWDRALLARCGRALVALALAFVAVAAVEYASRRLLFHTALNSNQRYFRVNSLFYDPNIYGRFLALTMVLVAAGMLWERSARRILVAAGVLVVLWLGLLGSVSQSSILALLGGLAVIAAARFSPRRTAAAAALILAGAVVVAIVAAPRLHLSLSDSASADNATAGRVSLVRQGIDLFADRPLAGFGSGSFSCEFLRHTEPSATATCGGRPRAGVTSESHTTPITIAAEQGAIGLLAYFALLFAALGVLGGNRVWRSPVRVALLAAFIALLVHTWAYADFLEDPIAWVLLAVGSVLARE